MDYYDDGFLATSGSDDDQSEDNLAFDWLDEKLLTFDYDRVYDHKEPVIKTVFGDQDGGQASEAVELFADQDANEIKTIKIDSMPHLCLIVVNNSDDGNVAILKGTATIELIYGQVSLNGYAMKRHKPLKVSVGLSEQVIFITVPDNERLSSVTIQSSISQLCLDDEVTKQIVKKIKTFGKDVAILLASKLNLDSIAWIESLTSCSSDGANWIKLAYNKTGFPVNKSWQTDIKKMAEKVHSDTRILIAGPRNSGKSSILKFIINQVTDRFQDGVIFVDGDPGQTEFSAPGQLTAVVVKGALICPSYVNVIRAIEEKSVIAAISVGAVSMAENVDLYLSSFKQLWDKVSEIVEDKPMPIFINTMGWTKGRGIDILQDMFKTTRANVFIELKENAVAGVNDISINVDDQSDDELDEEPINKIQNGRTVDFRMLSSVYSCDYHALLSDKQLDNMHLRSVKKLRNLAILAQISLTPNIKFKPLHELSETTMSLSGKYVHISSSYRLSSVSSCIKVLENSLVQLCRNSDLPLTDEIKVVERIDGNQLLGWAYLIRIEDDTAYLISNLKSDFLSQVNLIVRPNGISLPPELVNARIDCAVDVKSLPFTALSS
ncbi:Polynucleotide 5'-hydroxyl-kinase grc3 [Halotydeus destructor]|nr:Polynucleotide 5'-hydroxyl-kinase grc3 [Halotydeus destructor]